MTVYLYSGPPSGVTLQTADGPLEALLWPGQPVELPETHDYVVTLVALGRLTPVEPVPEPAPEPAPAPESKPAKKKEAE